MSEVYLVLKSRGHVVRVLPRQVLCQLSREKVIELPKDFLEHHKQRTYRATRSADRHYYCPVPGCVGQTTTVWNYQWHFCDRQLLDLVEIPEAGLYNRYLVCRMQTLPFVYGHRNTMMYREGGEQQRQYRKRCWH